MNVTPLVAANYQAFISQERGKLTGELEKLSPKDPHGKDLSSNDRLCGDDRRLSNTLTILSFSLAYVTFEGAHG